VRCARAGPRVSLRLASAYTQRASRGARGSRYAECSPARDPRARPSHLCRLGRKRGRAHVLHRAPWRPCAMGRVGRWHTAATCRPEGARGLARTRVQARRSTCARPNARARLNAKRGERDRAVSLPSCHAWRRLQPDADGLIQRNVHRRADGYAAVIVRLTCRNSRSGRGTNRSTDHR
jgi:hypothetical protein